MSNLGLANEPMPLSLGIPVRRYGADLLEPLDVEIDRLPAIENGLDNIRRKKSKRQGIVRVNRLEPECGVP